MKHLRQSCDGPRNIDLTLAEPYGLVIDGVKQAKPNGHAGGRLKRRMKARDHPRAHINGNCQHWTPNGTTKLLVDDDDVNKGMINLPNSVGSTGDELSGAWSRCSFNVPFPALAGGDSGVRSLTRRRTVL